VPLLANVRFIFLFLIFIYWKNPTVVTFLHTQFFPEKKSKAENQPPWKQGMKEAAARLANVPHVEIL
jgi:hypothetical protein